MSSRPPNSEHGFAVYNRRIATLSSPRETHVFTGASQATNRTGMATFTPLPREAAAAVVAHHGLGALIDVTPIAAGSVNSNYRVRVRERSGDERTLFLRIFEEQDGAGAAYEEALLGHLSARGVPTPCPWLGTPQTVDGKPLAVFPFVAGTHACQRSIDRWRARAMGDAIARVHLAGADFVVRRASRFDESALHARLATIAAADDANLARMAAPLEAALATWSAQRVADLPRGVIHGDLFRDNVLFAEEVGARANEVVALLDFESASDGVLAYDLAVTLLSWCFGDTFDVGLVRAMLEGYGAVRPLDARERAGLAIELRLAALRFAITRMTDYAMRTGHGPRVMKDWHRFWQRFQSVDSIEAGLSA
jgi:homoserine kinase type II